MAKSKKRAALKTIAWFIFGAGAIGALVGLFERLLDGFVLIR